MNDELTTITLIFLTSDLAMTILPLFKFTPKQ